MSLSLEVKRFYNDESIGDFVTVTLPGELPSDNEEIRAMNREKAAADKAARELQRCEEDEKSAEAEAAEAENAVKNAKKALTDKEKALAELQKKFERIDTAHKHKLSAVNKAKQALDEALARSKTLNEAAELSESNLKSAEGAKTEAENAKTEADNSRTDEKSIKSEDKTLKTDDENAKSQAEILKVEDKNAKNEAENSRTDGKNERMDGSESDSKPEKASEAKSEVKSEMKPEADSEAKANKEAAEKREAGGVKSEGNEKAAPSGAAAFGKAENTENAGNADNTGKAPKKAQDELKKATEAKDEAAKTADEKRREHEKLLSELSESERLLEAGRMELEGAKAEKAAAAESAKALEKAHSEEKNALTSAKRARSGAASEAERLNKAVRTLNTEHETARMHYLEGGKGETLLLIHTAGQSLYTFRSVFYKLAMNYHVVAVDLMGHGCSDRPEYFDYSSVSHAESLVSFMDALGIERAHLLGFSMGAGYALELAGRYPERVMSVIALSPGGVTGAMPLAVRMMESALFGGIASRLFRIKTVEKLLDECLFDHTVIGAHDVTEYYRPVSDTESRRAIRLTLSSYGERELIEALADVKTDVLIVSSDMDRWHSIELGEAYRDAVAGAELVVVRNAGHLLHEEKPDRIAEIVRSFIPAGYGDYDGREI